MLTGQRLVRSEREFGVEAKADKLRENFTVASSPASEILKSVLERNVKPRAGKLGDKGMKWISSWSRWLRRKEVTAFRRPLEEANGVLKTYNFQTSTSYQAQSGRWICDSMLALALAGGE